MFLITFEWGILRLKTKLSLMTKVTYQQFKEVEAKSNKVKHKQQSRPVAMFYFVGRP